MKLMSKSDPELLSRSALPPLALTTGEPAGIGPEISVKAAYELGCPLTLIGDGDFLASVAKSLGLPSEFPPRVSISHVPLRKKVEFGHLDAGNSPYVLDILAKAHELASSGLASGIVTGPVQKSIISDAGFTFTGHTEFFQELCGVDRVVMMLTSSPEMNSLKVALATTHLPIKDLPSAITGKLLDEVTQVLKRDLRYRFKIPHPRIAVTGLNPHAGENGYLGTEEIEIISPAIQRAQEDGFNVYGPIPADTAFIPSAMEKYDAVLCMYHDQGLTVLKHVGFSEGVNVTLGLPYVRTSVDHGTALDIAGTGAAQHLSMKAAIKLAHYLIQS